MLYRNDVDADKFMITDTVSVVLNNNVGSIVSYDEGNHCYRAYVAQGLRWNPNSSQIMSVRIENMERLKRVDLCAYNSVLVSAQYCELVIQNHFACCDKSTTMSVTFRDDACCDLP